MPSVSEIMESMDYGPAPEDSSEVRQWLAERDAFGHFIAGAFTPPGDGFGTSDPWTGEVLARVTQGAAEDVAAAVAAARTAQPGWATLPGHARARHLDALARTIQKRERFLAVLESLDTGMPIRASRDIDLPLTVRHFHHHAGWAELLGTEFPGHRPLGVCGQIIPCNVPLLMLARKVAPALAAGNTVVLKPAEHTPLTALAFAAICVEAGLPPGVVNIVTGDGETGAALVAAAVDGIAFTGSTEAGRRIAEGTAGTGKRLSLELGGASPFIVLADADLDAAVEGVVDSVWSSQGSAGSRILVAESVAAAFEARLAARMARLRVGPPLDRSTDIGAIAHPRRRERILALCRDAIAAGAELVGGLPVGASAIAPGYLRHIGPANPAMAQEILGPIATLSTFRTPDEAVELANTGRSGLAASVWSESVTNATDIAVQVRAGVVWINCVTLLDAATPFGGGREGILDCLAAPDDAPPDEAAPRPIHAAPAGPGEGGGIDETRKLLIGGAQRRPDSGASYAAESILAPVAGRTDVGNAVEAAHKAGAGAARGAHARAQVLRVLGETLARHRADFARWASEAEADAAIARCFFYAGFADKVDSATAPARPGHLTLVLPEPWGVIGLVCPAEAPLLGFLSLVLPAIAMGNAVVAVASQERPRAALELAQVLEASDLPAGVVNILTGPRDELATTLAAHDGVAALWLGAGGPLRAACERAAAGNFKPVWLPGARDWQGPEGQGRAFLRRATRSKTVWLPYGALPSGTAAARY